MTDEQVRDAFAQRMFGAVLGTADIVAVYLGERLGLYQHMTSNGAVTSTGLAAATNTDERYIREWLEQQAVTAILEVDDASLPALERRYSLPQAHAEVLLDDDSLAYLYPIARVFMASMTVMPQLLDAYRTGGGVPWEAFGADAYEAQAAQNRPVFLQMLGQEWLPAIPDMHQRLEADPPARVLEIGCGAGWACIGMAYAYPNIRIDGVDPDGAALALARANVEAEGMSDRITFYEGDAAKVGLEPGYDMITCFEMVHDLARPVEVLAAAKALLTEAGSIIVMDEKVAPEFHAPGDELERIFYGFSLVNCLPSAMSEEGAVGTGTVMRPDTLEAYARDAGLARFEILPIEHDFFRFYRLAV